MERGLLVSTEVGSELTLAAQEIGAFRLRKCASVQPIRLRASEPISSQLHPGVSDI